MYVFRGFWIHYFQVLRQVHKVLRQPSVVEYFAHLRVIRLYSYSLARKYKRQLILHESYRIGTYEGPELILYRSYPKREEVITGLGTYCKLLQS